MFGLFLTLFIASMNYLVIGDDATTTCSACINDGKVWQNGCFVPGSCSLNDFGCCLNEECCNALEGKRHSTLERKLHSLASIFSLYLSLKFPLIFSFVGCRNPNERMNALSCLRCRQQNNNRCIEKYWTGSMKNENSWYNGVSFQCSDSTLPKCASCSSREESNLRKLAETEHPTGCSTSICGSLLPQVDPCYNHSSCACYCLRIKRGIASCPHLSDLI